MTWPRQRYRTYVLGAGGLNFDDGKVWECEPDFLARYALARLAGASGGTIEFLSNLCFQASPSQEHCFNQPANGTSLSNKRTSNDMNQPTEQAVSSV